MKLKVEPEGREGVWTIEKGDLIEWLNNYPSDKIHNNIESGSFSLGADWSKGEVVELVEASFRYAILTGNSLLGNRGHALAVIGHDQVCNQDEKLYMFDIGPITEDDLNITTNKPIRHESIDELAEKILENDTVDEAGKPCPRCGSVNCVCDARPDDCE